MSETEKIQSECYSTKRKNNDGVKLHYANNCVPAKNECKNGQHEAFIFMEDVSNLYANSAENKVYYRCACLVCGKIDEYQMSRFDRRLTVYPHLDHLTPIEFYKIRKQYLELQGKSVKNEIAVAILNEVYKKENPTTGKSFIKTSRKTNL